MKLHHAAELIPAMTTEQFSDLKASIQAEGLRHPIVLLGTEILDGRHRHAACLELGIPPQMRQYDPAKDGPDPVAFVLAENIRRRHLTEGQRAAIGAELEAVIAANRKAAKAAAKASAGQGTADNVVPLGKAREEAAALAGVSDRSVQDAKKVKDTDPEGFQDLKEGKVSIAEAKKTAAAKSDNPDVAAVKPPGQLELATDPYRVEAADLLEPAHGQQFAEGIRTGAILKNGAELRHFVNMPVGQQTRIRDFVVKGWKPVAAWRFVCGEFESTTTLQTLIAYAAHRRQTAKGTAKGEPVEIRHSGWLVAFTPCPQTDPEADNRDSAKRDGEGRRVVKKPAKGAGKATKKTAAQATADDIAAYERAAEKEYADKQAATLAAKVEATAPAADDDDCDPAITG
jgi:ParB-like chromosome segregation protein Spo0J